MCQEAEGTATTVTQCICGGQLNFFPYGIIESIMQELKLYDPTRKPSDWTDLVHSGQYAVFHTDVQSDTEKKPDGRFLGPDEESTCLVFDSLAEAEAYCEAKVERISNLRCDIYDHT